MIFLAHFQNFSFLHDGGIAIGELRIPFFAGFLAVSVEWEWEWEWECGSIIYLQIRFEFDFCGGFVVSGYCCGQETQHGIVNGMDYYRYLLTPTQRKRAVTEKCFLGCASEMN
jgi:hypothetical protein